MPEFRREQELLTQHKRIHEGIDKLENLLKEVRASEKDFRLSELKVVFDSFGDVLWEHLDEEVRQLAPENMKKYWSMEEVRRIPL